MHAAKRIVPLALGVMLLTVIACGFSVSTASIKEAKLTSDEAGTQVTTVFSQDQVFYCVVVLENAPDDTVLKAVWTAVDVEGESPNTLINETDYTSGSDTITFNLSNDFLWPVGKYKVDLYLNDTLDRTLEFDVR